MANRTAKIIKLSLIPILFFVGLSSAPVQANHGHGNNVVAPIVAFIALDWIINHGHHRGYGRSNKNRKHQHGQNNHRKHSHSHGGYSHKPKHRYNH